MGLTLWVVCELDVATNQGEVLLLEGLSYMCNLWLLHKRRKMLDEKLFLNGRFSPHDLSLLGSSEMRDWPFCEGRDMEGWIGRRNDEEGLVV